jgi:cell division protein FtsI (penicillin-binding protein 3)
MDALKSRRVVVFFGLLAGWALLVILRLAQVQLVRAPEYRRRAHLQQERTVAIEPRRGTIYDRNGRELAVSVEAFSVFAVPDRVTDVAGESRTLARILGLPQAELREKLSSDHSFVWLARKVDERVSAELAANPLAGVNLLPEARRFYPGESLAAGVLGYVGLDGSGLAGLEYEYERVVGGVPGEMRVARDARQDSYALTPIPGREARQGACLRIALDRDLQFVAERELTQGIADVGARDGSVVLLDPESGEVLALASWPGFDPNRFADSPPSSWRNRPIADAFEPGSVFKVITGASAIDAGLASPSDLVDCGEGSIQVGNFLIHDAEHERFGVIPLSEVIARSSNVGIIRVGLKLGADRLYAGAQSFGVGLATGIDLPGENPGILREVSRWSGLSNAAISMGQEVAVTPIQIAVAMAAIANGGWRVTPRVVLGAEGDAAKGLGSPAARSRVISAATAAAMNGILKSVVSEGTGKKAAVPGFVVAGKTGTAQKAIGHGYARDKHVATFAGYVPAEHPRLVAVVTIDEPQRDYFASEVAAPVFARIVSRALTILNMPPSGSVLPAPPPPPPAEVLARSTPSYGPGVVPAALRQGTSTAPSGRMPDLAGMSVRRAVATLSARGLAARLTGSGFVVGQSPSPGSEILPGEFCELRLSESSSP